MEKIFWRNHTSSGSWKRVWREGWIGDQFEVLNEDSFNSLKTLVAGTIEVVEAEDEEE